MNHEYISISAFAKEVNLTPQAIYKQLNNKLKKFVKLQNGKKLISTNAFELFKSNQVDNNSNNELTTVVELLTQQLQEKDKQIANLQKLLDQSQQLQAQAENKIMMLEAPKKHWWQRKHKKEVVE